jgi:hypothetical protein
MSTSSHVQHSINKQEDTKPAECPQQEMKGIRAFEKDTMSQELSEHILLYPCNL